MTRRTWNRRDYCRCTAVQNWDYDEAAKKLRCFRRWLEDNISRLPHQKIGGSVAFCDCELALIQAICSVMPPGVLPMSDDSGQEQQEESPVSELAHIRPAGARKRRSVG
ncbi:hypothetical protein [Streptomyces sp. NPDC053560]|uniref:hypothetical protein n=1 Tax=Streptomyces sp. NPDC053560 TaxID=3365711 RepID=UPI0037CE63ED